MEPADTRLGQHQLEPGMPLECPGEDHDGEGLVEVEGQQRGKRRRLPFADLIAQSFGDAPPLMWKLSGKPVASAAAHS